ncbi:YwdI family protein [Ferdinandcohnia sp. Marseille-Q9671]
MNISVTKILDKMQLELQTAKTEANEQKVRERLLAIRTLCDLVLDEAPTASKPRRIEAIPVQPPSALPTATITNASKLKEEDANGDSLFDF